MIKTFRHLEHARQQWSSRKDELSEMLDSIAQVNWQHPAWKMIVYATATLEGRASLAPSVESTFYMDGSPRSDTFMARRTRQQLCGFAEQIAYAVAQAWAAHDAIAKLQNLFPGQPLRCVLKRKGKAIFRQNLVTKGTPVVFATPTGVWRANFDSKERSFLENLTFELAKICAGTKPESSLLRELDCGGIRPIESCFVVGIGYENLSTARHIHRRGWSTGGGAWLGLGLTDNGMEIISTHHLAIDGYPHGLLADEIFCRVDSISRNRWKRLQSSADRGLKGVAKATVTMPRHTEVDEIAIAMSIPSRIPTLAAAAYALGCALEKHVRGDWSQKERAKIKFTPTFHLPVAPGKKDDSARRVRRVVPGLLSVRMKNADFESFSTFQSRFPAFLARETAEQGPLTRIGRATVLAPLPQVVRYWLLSGGKPHWWLPPVEVLSGRSCLSWLRYRPDERPKNRMFGVSSPALIECNKGASVLTLIESEDGVTVTLSSKGKTQDTQCATDFLELWELELCNLPNSSFVKTT